MPQSTPTNTADERHLHILFNRWVPNSEDFTQTSHALALHSKDTSAIREEITAYRLNAALAKRTKTPYLAPWETLDLLKATVRDQNKQLAEQIRAVQTVEARVQILEEAAAGHAQAMGEKDKVIEEREEAVKQVVALLKEREESVMAAKEVVDQAVEMAGKVLETDAPRFWSVTEGDKQFLWIAIVGAAAYLLGLLSRG